MHGWAADVIGAVGEPEPNPAGYLDIFFAPQPNEPRRPGTKPQHTSWPGRANRDEPTSVADPPGPVRRRLQLGDPEPRPPRTYLNGIELPVFVANGDSDPMILPRYSYLLGGPCFPMPA